MRKLFIFMIFSSFLLAVEISSNWFKGLENPNGPTGELTVSFYDISLGEDFPYWGISMPITNSATIHYYNLDETIQVDLHIPLYKFFTKQNEKNNKWMGNRRR